MCGNCCSGSTGAVVFSEQEAVNMAAKLAIPVPDFYKIYARKRGRGESRRWELKEVRRANKDYDCVFLDRNTMPGKAICSLYKDRPLQCKTWPFWPENLESPEAWEEAKQGPEGCPGIGKGNVLVPYDEIIQTRDNAGL